MLKRFETSAPATLLDAAEVQVIHAVLRRSLPQTPAYERGFTVEHDFIPLTKEETTAANPRLNRN